MKSKNILRKVKGEFRNILSGFLATYKFRPCIAQIFQRYDSVERMINSHYPQVTPPRTFPQVLLKQKEGYVFWMTLHRDFPKVERFGIGNKIEQTFLDILELTFCLSYLPPEHKIPMLNKAITKLDILKFFVQLAWESKIIPTGNYSDLVARLEEIGRQLGGWKKGLQAKTPQP